MESRIQYPEASRAAAKSFEDLIVWQKAHAWVLSTYRLSERFPQKETYALTSQLRRSAMSVPANIAEGFKKRGTRDKLRYYNIAQGSLEESRYYFILARDLGYVAIANEMERLEEVSRLLESYCRTLLNSEF